MFSAVSSSGGLGTSVQLQRKRENEISGYKIVIINFQTSLPALSKSFLVLSVTLSSYHSTLSLYHSNYKVISDHSVWDARAGGWGEGDLTGSEAVL